MAADVRGADQYKSILSGTLPPNGGIDTVKGNSFRIITSIENDTEYWMVSLSPVVALSAVVDPITICGMYNDKVVDAD
jgi:hypothetical protein